MKLLLTLFLSLVISFSVLADATRVVTTEHGTFTEPYAGELGPTRDHSSLDDPVILWWRNLATGIFYSTSITTAQYAYSGSGLNTPREAAQYLIQGTGDTVMTLNGYEWEVAAAPHGGCWAAVNRDADNNNVLYFMADSLTTPVWTYTLGFGAVAGTDGLQFCEDGHLLALLLSRAPNLSPKLLVWDITIPDSIPLMDYDFIAGQGMYPRALEVSADGSVIAATADQYCLVIETDGGFVRNVIDFQASTDGLALSADGNFLMGAFQTAKLWRWNGTTYDLQWQWASAGRYCSQLLISPDTTYAVSCWYSSSYNRNYIRVHDIHNGSLIWAYTYHQGSGLQDWPVDVDISADGNWFAVGSWGDQGSNNGEAVVFSRWYPTPYYELDMPGSLFSLDLSSDGRYLIAGGKHVHANQFGNGGDLYVVDLDTPPAVPRPGIVESMHDLGTFTLCQDSAELSLGIFNFGYAPFVIDSISYTTTFPFGDEGTFVIDSTLFSTPSLPGDTATLTIDYRPCTFVAGTYINRFDVFAADTMLSFFVSGDFTYIDGANENTHQLPAVFSFAGAYPNPFNSSTSLSFSLPRGAEVNLMLVDILGREVQTIARHSFSAGNHQIVLNADGLASGIYFARLESPFGVRTQKLMLVR